MTEFTARTSSRKRPALGPAAASAIGLSTWGLATPAGAAGSRTMGTPRT